VVRTHAAELGRLDLLVIDVRGNQGGGDNTYMPILPLLYTDTIATVAGSVLSSPANIAYYEQFLDPAGVNSPAWVVEMLAAMRAQPGAQIALPSSTQAYSDVRPYPRAVAILMDGVAASSTETFLLKARQSSKVRLFGQPSAGIVDYLNPAHHPLGCGIVLQAPTIRRSIRLPADAIDNIGIAPDVLLPWNEPDPVSAVTRSYRR
jgi:C-terminal processing protease CtpA/Prc